MKILNAIAQGRIALLDSDPHDVVNVNSLPLVPVRFGDQALLVLLNTGTWFSWAIWKKFQCVDNSDRHSPADSSKCQMGPGYDPTRTFHTASDIMNMTYQGMWLKGNIG